MSSFHLLDDGAGIELDGEVYSPKAHEEFMIRPGVKHRFWAQTSGFRMLVVCFGQWKNRKLLQNTHCQAIRFDFCKRNG
jgi:hypothetical protein